MKCECNNEVNIINWQKYIYMNNKNAIQTSKSFQIYVCFLGGINSEMVTLIR